MNAPEFLGYANRKYWFTKDANFRNRTLLPPQIMANLKTTQISCVEYDNLGPEHEREMFQVGFSFQSSAKNFTLCSGFNMVYR
jgi:hypothetical protein